MTKKIYKKLFVSQGEKEERLDIWLSKKLTGISRSRIQTLIKSKKILINDKECQAKTPVMPGDYITTLEEHEKKLILSPKESNINLDILYEDKDLIVVNKPAGISVHPSLSDKEGSVSLVEALLFHCKKEHLWKEEQKISERPGVAHRLDKNTSGALVWAKNLSTLEHLQKQFKEKTNTREYLAILDGYMEEDSFLYESYLLRDPQNKTRFIGLKDKEEAEKISNKTRWAKTLFTKEAVFAHKYTLCRAKLYTGRTHQIRVHAKEIGLPILGDPVYNQGKTISKVFPKEIKEEIEALERQMLHAEILGFTHPRSGECLKFKAKKPQDFRTLFFLLKETETAI